MQTAVLDHAIEDEILKLAPHGFQSPPTEPEQSELLKIGRTGAVGAAAGLAAPPYREPRTQTRTRTAPIFEVRRLPAIKKGPLLTPPPTIECCDDDCGLADPKEIAGTVVRAAQEVINGARPLKMLTRWLSTDAFDSVRKRVSVQARSASPSRRTVAITSCHVCRIDHDTVEGTVILSDGGRIRAAVIRLEAFRGRWRATYLQTV